MPITVTATFECANITEFDEVMSLVRDNEPTSIAVSGIVDFDYFNAEADLTPPQGISRVYTDAAIRTLINDVVSWVRREVTYGPLSKLSDGVLTQAFFRLFDSEGAEVSLGDIGLSDVEVACIRGAYADFKGTGMPL